MNNKSVYSLIVSLAFLVLPLGASAQMGNSSSSSSRSSQSGEMGQTGSSASQDAAPVSGTVQSVDQKANTMEIKGTASELKNWKAGQELQLMNGTAGASGSSEAQQSVSGTVVRVSGSTVTIKTNDLSSFSSGQRISMTSGSSSNEQGLSSGSRSSGMASPNGTTNSNGTGTQSESPNSENPSSSGSTGSSNSSSNGSSSGTGSTR